MTLTYQDIVSPVIGSQISLEKFSRIGEAGDDSYAIYSDAWKDDLEFRKQFGLTDKLYDRWMYSGTEFNIYLNLDGETIRRCIVDKFRASEAQRPCTKVLEPTQQELRIARKILEYIMKGNSNS